MRVADPPLTQSDTDKATRLPRGPHALPQDVVIAHQRERLLDAAAAAMAEEGYAELTVRELIDRAGVSRRTFYQLFDDKTECIFAAHERAFERLSKVLVEACRTKAAWPDRVAAAIAGALAFAAGSPREAHLVVIACHTASEPKLAGRGHAAHEKLADLLRAGRKQADVAHAPPDLTEQAVVGAAMAVVGARLQDDEISALPLLAPELVQIVLTPYLGEGEAHRVAQNGAAYPAASS
jgi:AcrR family transcriptional regulator